MRWPTLPLSSKPSSLSTHRPTAFQNRLWRCARISSARANSRAAYVKTKQMDARTVRQRILLRARPTHSS